MSAEQQDDLLKLLLKLLPEITESLVCDLCAIYTRSTKNWWLVLKDLSITNPDHKYMPGVGEYLSSLGNVLTAYIQQQCVAFLQKYPSEEAYMEACQKKSSTGVQSRQASESSDGGFVLITHEDAKLYQGPKGPIKRK